MITRFTNCLIFNGHDESLQEGLSVLVENNRIREISEQPPSIDGTRTIDCGGRVLMPGLIDAHVHVYAPTFNITHNDHMPGPLMANHAAAIMEGMLRRGFTTIRDAAGGDKGIAMALEQGLISGPRFFYSGKGLSQTGGHGDMRRPDTIELCACSHYSGSVSRVVDGADEVRKAVREELRLGAHQIKIFASGGIASPADPLWMNQFTEAEIRAAVEEAETRRSYVMAHCHTDEATRRCVEFGVRSIEHGSQISADTATLIKAKDAFVVPTLSVLHVMEQQGASLNLPAVSLEKLKGLYNDALSAIENCRQAGVNLGLGSDLLGNPQHALQGGELLLRGEVNTPVEVLRSATSINAKLLQREGTLGCIAEGALADILVVEGNPLKNLELFTKGEATMPLIMRDGELIRNNL